METSSAGANATITINYPPSVYEWAITWRGQAMSLAEKIQANTLSLRDGWFEFYTGGMITYRAAADEVRSIEAKPTVPPAPALREQDYPILGRIWDNPEDAAYDKED